ncbi:MAG: Ada metal-binding domain-containing protein [bacterium]
MEKIKQFIESEKGKDILIVIIVILVGLGSFELGRLSKENSSSGIKIKYPSQEQVINQAGNVILATEAIKNNFSQNSNSAGKIFFASNRGSKYYTISCSAGKTIKQENRVYFTTGEEAQQAGYTLSSGCN